MRRVILHPKDLEIEGHTWAFLKKIVKMNEGFTQTEEDLAWLKIVSIALADQLDVFEAKRALTRKPTS